MQVVRERLFRVVDKWLAIMDRQAIDILMMVALHASMPGDPLWLLIIKASGAAKTELTRSLTGAKEGNRELVYTLDSLTPNTLVSGLHTKDGTDPSLLCELNDKLVVIKDFSEILTSSWDSQKRIYADLRQAYDGYLEKPFGSGVGKRGGYAHFGLIAAATPVIDTFNILTQELGERFLRLRLMIDEDDAISKAEEMAGRERQMRKELGEAFRQALEYHASHLDIASTLRVEVPSDKIKALSKVTSRLRSEVVRDRHRLVKIPPDPEIGTRLVKQFKALYRMSSVVLGQGDYDVVRRVARDCIPPYRLSIINQLKDGAFLKVKDIAEATNISLPTCSERLDDLKLLGVLETGGDNPIYYVITDRYKKLIEEANIY